jgi:hypothetical protein
MPLACSITALDAIAARMPARSSNVRGIMSALPTANATHCRNLLADGDVAAAECSGLGGVIVQGTDRHTLKGSGTDSDCALSPRG